jgi:DNA-binding transcriptional MocR family regulator
MSMTNFRFASRYENPEGSPIRELFPYLSKPGMISFAGGYPSPSLFDADGLRAAAVAAFTDAAGSLQYGATEGSAPLRLALAEMCGKRGIECAASDILVTTGSQQGFDLLLRVFIEPGDTVYIEAPAYPAAIQALRLAGARIQEIPADADGIDVACLAEVLANAADGDKPKLLYTVPTFSNPGGGLLAPARRDALVKLAVEHGFAIVDDDPYGELSFTDDIPSPLHGIGRRLAAGGNPVIYLASLSKTVAPALRIGWMVAPQEVLRRCAIAKQTSDLCTSPLSQQIAVEYLRSNRYDAALAKTRAEYSRRLEAMSVALSRQLHGSIGFVKPKGGMFIWAELAAGIDPDALFRNCIEVGVIYVPGKAFYASKPNLGSLRLSYATPDVDAIREGVSRLSKAIEMTRAGSGARAAA